MESSRIGEEGDLHLLRDLFGLLFRGWRLVLESSEGGGEEGGKVVDLTLLRRNGGGSDSFLSRRRGRIVVLKRSFGGGRGRKTLGFVERGGHRRLEGKEERA